MEKWKCEKHLWDGLVRGRVTCPFCENEHLRAALSEKEKECERLREHGYILAMRLLQSDLSLDCTEWASRDYFINTMKQALAEGEGHE